MRFFLLCAWAVVTFAIYALSAVGISAGWVARRLTSLQKLLRCRVEACR